MSQTNFLIGRGELLTHDIVGPKRMPGKAEVYTFAQARSEWFLSSAVQARRWTSYLLTLARATSR